jgi:hypothetical protein
MRFPGRCGRAVLLVLAVTLFAAAGTAAEGPRPPCVDGSVEPDYAQPGAFPNIRIWFADDLVGGWPPAACTQWPPLADAIVVATAGRFVEPGGIPAIAGRLAATSKLTDVRYWSATRQTWRPLIPEAHALNSPDRDDRREDFAVAEFTPGTTLYYWQHENSPAGKLVYRVDIREHSDDRLVLAMENATPVRFMLLPLFAEGEYRSLYFVERETGDTWRYYSLLRAPTPISLAVRSHRASYINRAAAIFRYVAGLPTDTEPPLAPKP